MSASNWEHLESCTVLRDTEKAILVEYEEEEFWIPRSCVSEGEKYEEGDEDVTLSVSEWFWKKHLEEM